MSPWLPCAERARVTRPAFGKNHQGDRDEHLPTMHGFDEFFGNLYHLNAEEARERGLSAKNAQRSSSKKFGPRGVLHVWANDDGTQKIEDTGPLTKKRMETVDDETSDAAIAFIEKQVKAGKPFFTWWNGTRVCGFPHPRQAGTARHLGAGRILGRHGRARPSRRQAAEQAGRAWHCRQHHCDVFDRQRAALQHLAGRGHDAFPQ